jgi:hypothetical protein
MGGGLMQLVAYGAQDIYLTGNPQITFFKVVYRRHTNFAMETVGQTFSGTADASKTVVATISRNGDLVGRMYVTSTLSGTTDGSSLVKSAEVEIGGQKIDKHTAEWMQIWNELSTPESKATALKTMQGCVSSGAATNVNAVKTIQVPLQFWFNRNPGLALPLIALQYHEVKVKIELGNASAGGDTSCSLNADYIYLDTDERRRFAQVSHEYLIEQVQEESAKAGKSHTLNFNHPVKELIWTNTAGADYNTAKLVLNGHDRFAAQPTEYFQLRQPMDHHTAVPGQNIPQLDTPNMLGTPIDSGITSHNTSPSGVIAVNVAIGSLTYAASQTIPFKVGDLFVSSVEPASADATVSGGLMHKVTAVSATVVSFTPSLESPPANADAMKVFIVARAAGRCRTSQLAKKVNCYSFALKPEEHQPSGTCNFSRIDNAQLVTTGGTDMDADDKIYAVNYNVLRVMSGMGGLAYSN